MKKDKLREWYISIRNRDGWTCQVCGAVGSFEAHHVFGRVGELRTDIDNGIYLCRTCHEIAHSNTVAFRAWWSEKYPARAERVAKLGKRTNNFKGDE